MKGIRSPRIVLAALTTVLMMSSLMAWAPPAEAQVNPANAVVGVFRVFNAINRRNRTYRAARETQQDFNSYYDALQDTAREQLISGDLSSLRQGEDGLERSRAAAYIRMSAALRAEEAAITRAIDAETNQARRDFNRALVSELQSIIIQLPGAQEILGQVRSMISNIRTTVLALHAAAASGQPVDAYSHQLAGQLEGAEQLQGVVRGLGSLVNDMMAEEMGGALAQVNRTMDDVTREAEQAVELLNTMDAEVSQFDLSEAECMPYEVEIGPISVQLTERASAVLDVASQALAFLSATQRTGGVTREELYQQIRTDLLNQRNAALLSAAQQVRSVVCQEVDRSAYEAAMGSLHGGRALQPDAAGLTYYVCTNQETRQPIGAWIGGLSTIEEAEATATGEPLEPTETAETRSQEEEVGSVASVDAAEMIDITASVTNSYNNDYEDYCMADIDITNLHPTDTLLFVCQQYSYIQGYEVVERAVGAILEPGEVQTYQAVWHTFQGEIHRETYLSRCVAYRRSTDGEILPVAQWIGETYGPYELAIFESGLTIVDPPNPCAP